MHNAVGKQCRLLKPIGDPNGKTRYREEINPTVIRVTVNLDREMYHVRLNDGLIMILFPREIEIIEEENG